MNPSWDIFKVRIKFVIIQKTDCLLKNYQPRICLIHSILHEAVNCELNDFEKEMDEKLIHDFSFLSSFS